MEDDSGQNSALLLMNCVSFTSLLVLIRPMNCVQEGHNAKCFFLGGGVVYVGQDMFSCERTRPRFD
jgi:hypothetical protein